MVKQKLLNLIDFVAKGRNILKKEKKIYLE